LNLSPDYRTVLAHYPADCQPEQVEFLATAGGFSGALLWKLHTPRGLLGLRRWPQEHPSADRLPQIHSVLHHVSRAGFGLVPAPLPTRSARTFVAHQGHLWELAPWMPGESSYATAANRVKLVNALQALARFHVAAAGAAQPPPGCGPSPGIRLRLDRLRWWATGGLDQLRATIASFPIPQSPFPIASASRLCDLFDTARPAVEHSLTQAIALSVPWQACIRDVWHENVLFTGDEVSGLIDFGALDFDTVSTDVARLLGSLAADDAEAWRAGLSAYESVRPLSPTEAVLITAFDRANVLLSGLNWCRWHYLDGRQFADRSRVLQRVEEHLRRLNRLAASSLKIA
jgi:Ser/Thr protein kinase RdoA (MazF antagonist)